MSTQLPETFEPEKEEGNTWNLIFPGEYVAQIVEASVTQPKSMDGYYILLVWKILEGEYEGRQVWQRIAFTHSKEQTRTIGRKMLKSLCIALSVAEHVEDVEVFLFKSAKIKVGIEVDRNGVYDDKNVVKRIWPLDPPTDGNGAGASQPAPKPDPQAGVAAAPKPQTTAATKGPVRPGPAGTAPWHQQKS
jgi:hypothetical protein